MVPRLRGAPFSAAVGGGRTLYVPPHQSTGDKTCARAICEHLRTAEGDHQYCSAECRHISRTMHGARLPALEGWSWLPLAAGEVRVPDDA